MDAITCPRCGLTSHNPTDVAEGYCGHCHDWTGRPRPDLILTPGVFAGHATITLPADNDVDGKGHTSAPPRYPPAGGADP